jgi:hypothetical protein
MEKLDGQYGRSGLFRITAEEVTSDQDKERADAFSPEVQRIDNGVVKAGRFLCK